MMMYLDEGGADRYYDEFVRRLTEFMNVIGNPAVLTECVEISKNCMEREYYHRCLARCRKLMDCWKTRGWGNVPTGVSGAVATWAESPRQMEYRLFAQVTLALIEACWRWIRNGHRGSWWTRSDGIAVSGPALGEDCASLANGPPFPSLRASTSISLAIWVGRCLRPPR